MMDIYNELIRAWPAPIVSRQEVARFSGGALHPRTLANLDSLGNGPPGRFRVGRRVVYPTAKLAEWLSERIRPIEQRR